MITPQQRTEGNIDALIRPLATLPDGRPLRPLGAGAVTLARKLGLKLFTGSAAERQALAGDELELEIYAVAWLLIEDPATCWRATRNGWEFFCETTLLPWIFALPVAHIAPILAEITTSLAELGMAVVEPQAKREAAAPETAPPNI